MGAPGDMVGFGGEESSFPARGSLCIHRDSSPLGSAQGARSREGMLGRRVGRMPSPVRPSPAFPSWEKAVPALRWQQCPCLSLSVSLTLAFPRTFLAPAFPSSPPWPGSLLPLSCPFSLAVPWPLTLANLSGADSTVVFYPKSTAGWWVVPAGGKPQSHAVPQFPQASTREDVYWPS